MKETLQGSGSRWRVGDARRPNCNTEIVGLTTAQIEGPEGSINAVGRRQGKKKEIRENGRGGKLAEGGKIRLLLVLGHEVERGAGLEPGQLPGIESMAERDVLGRSATV
jgi:hypothetical protein